MLLADMGATVIKVESPAGDETRTWTPPERDGVSTYYLSINRNKQSIVLDFNDADDVALDPRAAAPRRRRGRELQAGRAAQVRARLRVGRGLNPRLVYLSISGFGTAEGAWLPGYDLVVQAVSGLMSLTGDTGRRRLPRRASPCST